MENLFSQIKGKLIVSCQALKEEPLHGPAIMAKMAKAAKEGGAAAIRANSKEDILAIKQEIDLPVIGIVKRDYGGSEIYITATRREADELIAAGVEMIALDATKRKRPSGETLEGLVSYIHQHHVLVMADISTLEEALYADKIGCDCVSTTLSGYTSYSRQETGPDFTLIQEAAQSVKIPVIAEGRIGTPKDAARALAAGAHAVVVGSAITRPQLITKTFTDGLLERGDRIDGNIYIKREASWSH
ncbi:N-acetylmannosamine-6-phosphate 2-epimerase [Metabacillus sp. JX24]|uniref:N-acetylmannosamine-6-phosphate 2-epimerase n=1 Tax=Metabacillus sp. JX24 TaxID=3240759 RepID=UPI00350F64E5